MRKDMKGLATIDEILQYNNKGRQSTFYQRKWELKQSGREDGYKYEV